MNRSMFLVIGVLLTICLPASAQRILSLDSCRALALRNNKQLNITRLKQDVARNTRKAMRTKYLPKVDVMGGYEYFSREISILNNDQKTALSNLGTNSVRGVSTQMNTVVTGMVERGLISPEMAQQLGTMLKPVGEKVAAVGNQFGEELRDAFKTDTKNMWAGAVMLRQPLYMGGAITAANKIADLREEMAVNENETVMQNTLLSIDQTYWTVVSLKSKQQLALSYRDLVQKLDEDIHKMIEQGVATRADGLKVDVRANEAEMQLTQVENGLSLAKMLLCQLCGLPLEEDILLVDEVKEGNSKQVDDDKSDLVTDNLLMEGTNENRPELRMLQNVIDMSRASTKLIRAAYLPQVALTGGYVVQNPNVYNGFQRRFTGIWNVGVMVRVPVWNWFEGEYKVRASKASTNIACMEMNDAQEKIDLQVAQSRYKVSEAQKRLAVTQKNIASAEENLRCANVGFREGVIEATDVMAAQTAWHLAQSQRIDAEIDVRMSQISLRRSLGVLY